MTFQAYLDNIEKQTGVTPEQWVELSKAKGFGPGTKATPWPSSSCSRTGVC